MPTFQAVPILRIFDVEKVLDFYVGFLGFHVDWETQAPVLRLLRRLRRARWTPCGSPSCRSSRCTGPPPGRWL
ncbi:MAG: glyoxalase superfamily protein [Thermoleophilaceae bacterium]